MLTVCSFELNSSLTKSNFDFGTAVFNTLPGIMSFNLSAKSWKSSGRFWGCTNGSWFFFGAVNNFWLFPLLYKSPAGLDPCLLFLLDEHSSYWVTIHNFVHTCWIYQYQPHSCFDTIWSCYYVIASWAHAGNACAMCS